MPGDYPLEDLASLPSFHHPAASHVGDEVAVYYDGTGRNELYVVDPESGERTRISDGEVPRDARYPFRWAPSGESFFFHRDEGGDEQNDVARIDRDGEVEVVVENDSQCFLNDVTADGRRLLYATDAGQQMNLYEYDRESGERTRVTDYSRPVGIGHYAPGGDRVAYTTNETDDLDNEDVYVADLRRRSAGDPAASDDATSDARTLDVGERGAEAGVSDWHPDGDRLLVSDDSTDRSRCGVYDLERDEVTWYTDERHVERPRAFLPDGSGFLATRTRECAVVPVVYDLDGECRELDLPEGVASFPGTTFEADDAAHLSDSAVLISQETPTDRPRLLAYDLDADEARTVLEPEYGNVDPDGFVDCEYDTIESHDGLAVEVLVYDSGVRPSPAVVNPHGGPPTQDLRGFDQYAQFLAARGYTVLQVNFRGSTGRGREFRTAINGDWGGAEQGDIAAATRWLAEKEWVDGDRVAVAGVSYGGYSANVQLLEYPDLYAAGIARVGITDLHALHEESMPHFQTFLEKYMGDPGENAELYRERSPIEHVENLSAPLCIVHGVNDSRVPVGQARRFRDALQAAGYEAGEEGDFEYNELGEEGHGSSDIDQRIRSYRIVADFLARRVPVDRSADAGE